MRKGKQTKNIQVKEKFDSSWPGNFSTSARNMRKNELAAVIFGCKKHTFNECKDRNIFGLPAPHFSYVKNVTPDLTLFLFNYTDRTLHGIFEAATTGQMNIDPYAWTSSENTEITPYPAQVKVKLRSNCRPLSEKEFRPVIEKNYYTEKCFWFELDTEQLRKLITLFSPLPLPAKPLPRPPNAAKPLPGLPNAANSNNMFDLLSRTEVDNCEDEGFTDVHSLEYPGMQENEDSYATVVTNRFAFAPERKWCELFKTSSSSNTVKSEEDLASQKLGLNSPMANHIDMEWKFTSSSQEISKPPSDADPGTANTESDSYVAECWEELADVENANEICENNLPSESLERADSDLKSFESECMVSKAPEEDMNSKQEVFAETINLLPEGVLADLQSSGFESVIIELMRQIKDLKTSHLNQNLKSDSLEHEVVYSKLEIDRLKNRCLRLESMPSSASDRYATKDCEPSNITSERSVLIVGGFDGETWLQDFSLYSPSEDQIMLLCPMPSSRSFASVAKMDGELYIFGGVHNDVWYNTVESYSPERDEWFQRPSLSKRKGNIAGASLHGKIFAIGGGNGVECFSEVELLDLNVGRWIPSKSMLEKRFASAAADLNGAIYVAGGYNATDYLRSVERFDPREHAWTSLGSMNTRRGCHSLVTYNEKLFALGGYDGDKMVPTVESFDPRMCSWIMEEPMTVCRGYFGSFVLGGRIYVIGGLEDKEVSDVVECYGGVSGWRVTGNTTALGKRCFFASLVL